MAEPSEIRSASNERDNHNKQINGSFERICGLFSPLRNEWPFIQDVLLWKKLEISVIVFNILNVLFWVFLTPRFQLFVGVGILLTLLWVIPPIRRWLLTNIESRKLSTRHAENVESEDSVDVSSENELVTSCEKKLTSYEDFCHGVAVIWDFLTKCWIKLKNLKKENIHKFYVVVAVLIVLLAVVYTQFPIGNIVYLTVMLLYLWPAIVYYGIKDKVAWKSRKLFRPFFTQWQSSRTKRKRATLLEGRHNCSDVSEDEDFTLNPSENETIISSAISSEQRAKQEQPTGPLDSVDSSLTFVDGLEFPSMRRDSVESFNSDDFVQGLNFNRITTGDRSHHSSIDSLVGESDGTVESQNDHLLKTTKEEYIHGQLRQDYEAEMRRRTREQSSESPSRNKSFDDVESYEVIHTSEVEAESNNDGQGAQEEGSYISSGTKYVGKLFGYS